MELTGILKKIPEYIKKYRYVVLVLAIGLILMAIPEKSSASDSNSNVIASTTNNETSVSDQLRSVLSKIEGAGNIEVMLTVSAGEEIIYQTDQDISVSGESNSTRSDTVTLTDADRNQVGLIKQVNPPSYMGAIIVCQGADSPTVKLAIVEAVSKITGLSSDRICVLKMK